MYGEKKPRVFLSSAIKDLVDLRSEIISFFEHDKGYLPICYGDVSSGGLTGKPGIVKQCLDGVRSSDAFVLIIDKKYGIPDQKDEDGNPISITELEYLEAVKQDIEIYIFCRIEVWVAHEIWLKNPDMSFEFDKGYDDHSKQLMIFLTKLKKGIIYQSL